MLIFNGSYTFQMLDQRDALMRGVDPVNLGNHNRAFEQGAFVAATAATLLAGGLTEAIIAAARRPGRCWPG